MDGLIVGNKSSNILYYEDSVVNEILIGQVSSVIGMVESINDLQIVLSIAHNLKKDMAILFKGDTEAEDEIRRVDEVIDSTTFTITKKLFFIHVGENVEINFYNNKDNLITSDNFGNNLFLPERYPNILIEECTVFNGINNIFIYNNTGYESVISNTFSINQNYNMKNIIKTPVIVSGENSMNYILNMKITDVDTFTIDNYGNYSCTISDIQENKFKIYLNNNLLTNNYIFNGTTLTINSSCEYLKQYDNYLKIYHYQNQSAINKDNIEIRFKIYSYDKVIIDDKIHLDLLKYFNFYTDLSDQESPEYYEYNNNKIYNGKKRIKINNQNKLAFSNNIVEGEVNNIEKIINENYFRILLYNEETHKLTYFYECKNEDGTGYTEGKDINKNNYSISYSFSISAYISDSSYLLPGNTSSQYIYDNSWGNPNYKWGEFTWGM